MTLVRNESITLYNAKVVGYSLDFLRVSGFPPCTENVDRVGWDKPHVDFFYRIAVLLDHEEKESHRLDQVELRPS